MVDDYQDSFIRGNFGSYTGSRRLAGDASTRVYHRIYGCSGSTCILCEDRDLEKKNPEDYAYYILYNIFRENGIPVPEVYAWDSRGLLLVRDLGDDILEIKYDDLPVPERKRIYTELIGLIVRIQGIKRKNNIIPFALSFDIEKLMFEFDFFVKHAMSGCIGVNLSAGDIQALRQEFLKISGILNRPDIFVLNHRDLISRNIILFEGKIYLIDFQDARLGLPQYDLVSLLRDSYPQLDDDLYAYLKDHYYHLSLESNIHSMSRDEFEYYFDIMAFQRNVKAIGTFAYQAFLLGREKYRKYIQPTLFYLKAYAERRDDLKTAYNIIMNCIGDVK